MCFVFGVLPACVHGHGVCHGWVEWVEKPEEGAGAPRTGVADGWETPHGWRLNLGSLEEQPVF